MPSLFLFREAGRAVREDANAAVPGLRVAGLDRFTGREAGRFPNLILGRPAARAQTKRGYDCKCGDSFHGANLAQRRRSVNG
jgi:hypothetical protein